MGSPGDAGAAEATAHPSGFARHRQNFRGWRRRRPFWGGLFTLLAGLEIFLSTQLDLGDLQLKVGLEGLQAYIIPAALVLAGLLIWFTPEQRIFYGVLAALIAVYSLIGVNFGGFFVGMLLGIVGGALAASWTRVRPPVPADDADTQEGSAGDPDEPDRPDGGGDDGDRGDDDYQDEYDEFGDRIGQHVDSVDTTRTGPLTDVLPSTTSSPIPRPRHRRDPDDRASLGSTDSSGSTESFDAEPGGADDRPALPRRSPPLLAVTLVPIAVLVAAVAVLPGNSPAHADPCPSPTPSGSAAPKPSGPAKTTPPPGGKPPTASPSPSPSASPSPSPSEDGQTLGGALGDLLGNLLGRDKPAAKAPASTPPGAAPAAPAAPGRSPAPNRRTPNPKPSKTPAKPKPSATTGPCQGGSLLAKELPPMPGQPLVARRPGVITGSRVEMHGLSFDGVVNLPTKGGTIRTLQFTMKSSTTYDFELRIPENTNTTTSLKSTALTVQAVDKKEGDDRKVVFYTNRFSGNVFGVLPMTFTPDAPPPITLPEMFFTDPNISLVFITCDQLLAPNLRAQPTR